MISLSPTFTIYNYANSKHLSKINKLTIKKLKENEMNTNMFEIIALGLRGK